MSDYTPGHAVNDILAAFGRPAETRAQLARLGETTARLYKAGQANERAAIVAGLRSRGGSKGDPWGVHAAVADMVERGELS